VVAVYLINAQYVPVEKMNNNTENSGVELEQFISLCVIITDIWLNLLFNG
jgi:hypothetical protein